MNIQKDCSLQPFNTFNINVKTDYLIEYDSVEDLQEVLKTDIFKSNQKLHVGCGSNLLFLNDYRGIVLHSKINFIHTSDENSDFVYLEVGAGVIWDDFVAYCVENSLCGVENLSLIPGEVGASAVQNIGAYGVEVKDVIDAVNTVEIASGNCRKFSNYECNYGYRESVFKNDLKGRFIVTSVVFKLNKKPLYKLNYQHLEEEVLKNGELSLSNIRQTIISVRNRKLPDPKILGNAGSFFMNPVISKQHFQSLLVEYPNMPHYFVSETQEKVPAGWLIEQCGWKGKSIGNAGVHEKQALVLINKGCATGAEIVFLAEQIQHSVKEKFNIELYPEANYI